MTELECNKNQVTDIIVKTGNPAALDCILQQFSACVCQIDINKPIYKQRDGGYVVRCFGDSNFIKFLIKNQGYGEVVDTFDKLVE